MVVFIGTIAAMAGLLAALFILVRKIVATQSDLPLNAEWIDELSIERYRPMVRLLDERDLEFLRSQPGFTPRMAARLRQQRSQIFRGYLRCLAGDFQRVCTAVKVLMLQSRRDRPDLASALVRSQAAFAAGMTLAYIRLFFYRWGVCGVDPGTLMRTFDVMRLELSALAPAAAGAAA
ncbi:MAG: hypothetical protein LAQ30_08845 [Acidobacteriia bacterium]|nr:hypothetical protein [Terriglobia bacterium]